MAELKDSLTAELSLERKELLRLCAEVEDAAQACAELRKEVESFKSWKEKAKEDVAALRTEVATLKEGKTQSEKILWAVISGLSSLLVAALSAWLGGVFSGKK